MARVGLSLLERIVRQDRAVILVAVTAIVLLTGVYTISGVGMNMSALELTRMARPIGVAMNMEMVVDWTFSYAALIFIMWWVMMIAMMTPSAAPTLLLFAALRRSGSQVQSASADTGKFLAGYLLAWAAFSIFAACTMGIADERARFDPDADH